MLPRLKFASVAVMPSCAIGSFCRVRWFLRYARGEARLCAPFCDRLLTR